MIGIRRNVYLHVFDVIKNKKNEAIRKKYSTQKNIRLTHAPMRSVKSNVYMRQIYDMRCAYMHTLFAATWLEM